METPKTIRSILAKGESAHVEFKSATASLEALGETICAFLNSGGGQIVVGVRDGGRIEGEVSAKKIEKMLRQLSGGTVPGGLITPNAVWDVSEERLDEGVMAIIDVPSGGDLPYVFRDSIFIRIGSQVCAVFLFGEQLPQEPPAQDAVRVSPRREAQGEVAGLQKVPGRLRAGDGRLVWHERIQFREDARSAIVRTDPVPGLQRGDRSWGRRVFPWAGWLPLRKMHAEAVPQDRLEIKLMRGDVGL